MREHRNVFMKHVSVVTGCIKVNKMIEEIDFLLSKAIIPILLKTSLSLTIKIPWCHFSLFDSVQLYYFFIDVDASIFTVQFACV